MPAESRPEATPFDTILQISTAYWLSRCLHVVADLGVADALGDTPQSLSALAEATGTHTASLGRLLRLLSAHGIFKSRPEGFAHTPSSQLLRKDHPQSMRALIRATALPIYWESYGRLDYSVRTGLPAVEQIAPGGLWNYLAGHPDANEIFNQAMTAKAQGQIAGVIAAYSFSGFATIGDLGGGRGHLLKAVLAATPGAKGVLFDLPHVIDQVSGMASDRLWLQGGDFFKDQLPVCDAYLMMDVINTWNDDRVDAILKNVRRAAPAHAKLLLVESVISEDSNPSWAKMLDITMLALLSGKQRTRAEHERLLAVSGFRLERVVDVRGTSTILEAVPI
jgi:hypothetical protein